jgi:hypothetical protein
MGFMSTFHFEARDRIAMAEVTTQDPDFGNDAALDMTVYMPQLFPVSIPAKLRQKATSIDMLKDDMPCIHAFARHFFMDKKQVVVDLDLERQCERVTIAFSSQDVPGRLLFKFGFRFR